MQTILGKRRDGALLSMLKLHFKLGLYSNLPF